MPSHPQFAADHELNRAKICAPCGLKVSSVRPISGKNKDLVKKFYPNFDVTDARFPKSICNTCRLRISQAENDPTKTSLLPEMPDFDSVNLKKDTRSNPKSNKCFCYICSKARSPAHAVTNGGGRGKKRVLSNAIPENIHPVKVNDPISSVTPSKTSDTCVIKICATCRQEI